MVLVTRREVDLALSAIGFPALEVPLTDLATRRTCWFGAAAALGLALLADDVESLARTYRLSASEIEDAAQIAAGALGLQLWGVELSTVISKYIGETEKNLDRIFTAAKSADVVLIFDEADALFGKRSEIRDSHDRYANVEISYLLQRMEEHDGVTVLATNLRSNLDTAFLRRLAFDVRFPFPDDEQRLLIWQRVYPVQVPLGADVDFADLAVRYRLSGGQIRNVAVASAYLAASESSLVRARHVEHAIRREYQKLGQPLGADLSVRDR
jgi:SpoVK/Ycf46/Vps4 family AAA+-type ATPase